MTQTITLGHFGSVDKVEDGGEIWYNKEKGTEKVMKMQLAVHMVTIEELVPREHYLRRLEAVLDLSFVYEETSHLYSRRYGRLPLTRWCW